VDEEVDAAVAQADRDGLAALTMRALAEHLGIAPMSVYTYVPGRNELLTLMVDQVIGRTELPPHAADVRARLSAVAEVQLADYRRHPWLLDVSGVRPWLGPHASDRYEWQLGAVDGLGLDDVEMDQAVAVLVGFAAGIARDYPLATRVGAAAGEAYGAATDPEREFAFGLALVVDGLLAHVEGRS
jgi:AcrR family transcriptional regulator